MSRSQKHHSRTVHGQRLTKGGSVAGGYKAGFIVCDRPVRAEISPMSGARIPCQRSRKALATTLTDDRAIAAAATMGDNKIPKTGYRAPAATGTPTAL